MNEILVETLNLGELKRMLAVVLAMWLLMVAAVLVDLWSGIEKAKARKEYVDSGGFRRTFAKLGEYWRVLAMLLLVDIIGNMFPWYSFPFASMLGTVAVIAIEFRSVIENLRAKHSSAADIPDMIRQIIQCTDRNKAAGLIEEIKKIEGIGKRDDTGTDKTNES